MKIKLDENLPARLADILNRLGHNTDTIPNEGYASSDDNQVWKLAQQTQRFLIAQDLDFSDIRKFIPGTHHGILLIRLRNPGREALLQRIEFIFKTENVELWKGCFVVVTEHKIRIKYPE
jgi:predicted nuclease of predicted toxin-antitoxin system